MATCKCTAFSIKRYSRAFLVYLAYVCSKGSLADAVNYQQIDNENKFRAILLYVFTLFACSYIFKSRNGKGSNQNAVAGATIYLCCMTFVYQAWRKHFLNPSDIKDSSYFLITFELIYYVKSCKYWLIDILRWRCVVFIILRICYFSTTIIWWLWNFLAAKGISTLF